jgi:hypothetical protein
VRKEIDRANHGNAKVAIPRLNELDRSRGAAIDDVSVRLEIA